jgi:hypothetical protein
MVKASQRRALLRAFKVAAEQHKCALRNMERQVSQKYDTLLSKAYAEIEYQTKISPGVTAAKKKLKNLQKTYKKEADSIQRKRLSDTQRDLLYTEFELELEFIGSPADPQQFLRDFLVKKGLIL